MNTLAYFDIMNLADRVKVPVLMSIGLIDRGDSAVDGVCRLQSSGNGKRIEGVPIFRT